MGASNLPPMGNLRTPHDNLSSGECSALLTEAQKLLKLLVLTHYQRLHQEWLESTKVASTCASRPSLARIYDDPTLIACIALLGEVPIPSTEPQRSATGVRVSWVPTSGFATPYEQPRSNP